MGIAKGVKRSADDERNFISERDSYLEDCENKHHENTKYLCNYYRGDAELRARKLAETQRKHQESVERNTIRRQSKAYEVKGPSQLGSFASGFGQGLIVSSPYLVTEWARYDSTKQWKKQQYNQIANMETAYTKRLEYYDWLKENNYTDANFYASNWGTGNYFDSYNYQSTFQSGNNVFNDQTNPYQFSFAGPMTNSVTSTTGVDYSNFSTGSTGNQTYEFSF
jgi:hypothetical protein